MMASVTTLCSYVTPALKDLPTCARLMVQQVAARVLAGTSARRRVQAARAGRTLLQGNSGNTPAANNSASNSNSNSNSNSTLQLADPLGGLLNLQDPATLAALLTGVAAQADKLPAGSYNPAALNDTARINATVNSVSQMLAIGANATSLQTLLSSSLVAQDYLAAQIASLAAANSSAAAAALNSFANSTSSAALSQQVATTPVPGDYRPFNNTNQSGGDNAPPPPPSDSGGGDDNNNLAIGLGVGLGVGLGLLAIGGVGAGVYYKKKKADSRRDAYNVSGAAEGADPEHRGGVAPVHDVRPQSPPPPAGLVTAQLAPPGAAGGPQLTGTAV